MTTAEAAPYVAERASPRALQPKKVRPVVVWAAIGAGFALLAIFVWTKWLLSSPGATPTGPTRVPRWMAIEIHTFEVLSVLGGVTMVWFFLIRPIRRTGRITTDGLLILVFPMLYWQDLAGNYTQVQALYNSEAINLGSWFGNVPGWLAPHGNQQVEPFVWVLPAYLYMPLGGAILGGFIMRTIRRRRPTMSNAGMVAWCFLFMALFDLVIEIGWTRMGMYSYTSVIKGWTLFAGHYYQFPIYEAKLFGLAITGWACLRHFKNDKGQTLAERGIDELGLSRRKELVVRYLALLGAANMVFLCLYNIPFQWTGTHANYSPADIHQRSYLTNNLCGAGSEVSGVQRPCADNTIPIPKRGGPYIGSNGAVLDEHGAPITN